MTEPPEDEGVDFALTPEFFHGLGDSDLHRHETYLFFFPIHYVYSLYRHLKLLLATPPDGLYEMLGEIGFFEYVDQKFIPPLEHQDPVYRFIYLITTNQLDGEFFEPTEEQGVNWPRTIPG